jgi:hypothetical protein
MKNRIDAALARLSFDLGEYPAYEIADVAKCAKGHDVPLLKWGSVFPRSPPYPIPPLLARRSLLERRAADPLLPHAWNWASKCEICGGWAPA